MANTQSYLIVFLVFNIILLINSQYIGKLGSLSDRQAFLKQSFELICEYNGADRDGKFVDWYRDNESVTLEKPGHYIVKNTATESRLFIKVFVEKDGEIKKWSVRTKKEGFEQPVQCQFNRIAVKASPQGINGDRNNEKLDSPSGSIRRLEGESARLICIIKPNTSNSYTSDHIKWEYSKNDETYSPLPHGVNTIPNDQILISSVKKSHRGYYRCTLNNVSFTVLLRVKDRLAALWPFLGIVAVVLLLVLVILIFEKRRKTAKKATTAYDDDNTHANDPLVRSTNKSSDNESKKRAIKT